MMRVFCIIALAAFVTAQDQGQDGQVFEVEIQMGGKGLEGMQLPDPEMLREIAQQMQLSSHNVNIDDMELPEPAVLQQIAQQLLEGREVTVPEGIQMPNAEMLQQMVNHLNNKDMPDMPDMPNLPDMDDVIARMNELSGGGLQLERPQLAEAEPQAEAQRPHRPHHVRPRPADADTDFAARKPEADPSFYTVSTADEGECVAIEAFNHMLVHCEIVLDTVDISHSQACGDRRCKHALVRFVEQARRPACASLLDDNSKLLAETLAAQTDSLAACGQHYGARLYTVIPYIIFGLLGLSVLLCFCTCLRARCVGSPNPEAYGQIQEEPASAAMEQVAIPVAYPKEDVATAYPVAYPSA